MFHEKLIRILINKDSFSDYPAVLLNLKNNSIIKIWNDFRNEISDINADLWIEPRDAEIMWLNSIFEGRKHKGEDTKVKLSNKKYDLTDLNYTNTIVSYEWSLWRTNIAEGVVFIVKASDNSIYKIKIISFDKLNEIIELEYELVK